MKLKELFSWKMLLLMIALLLLMVFIIYMIKQSFTTKAEMVKIIIAGFCCGFLIFATLYAVLQYI
ncbi:MAG: hypothetical protein LUG99_06000 [Lachnospiraceae bacterium]|nr:hypothetical protein [Lachnospiraceae bacterium]MCD8012715.1 hypothetical protein [Lachnospiraceae bacterium]